jgi:hypothetical protein
MRILNKEKVQPEKKLKLNSIEVDADFATILFTHASPGCAYYFYGGQWWYICS